eukprot:scaffold550_cov303-Pavlova_lutheri.AAC.8
MATHKRTSGSFLHGIGVALEANDHKKHRTEERKEKLESGLHFEKLTSENYPSWQLRMRALLVTKGIESALVEKEYENSEQALALMCLCLTNEYVDMIAQSARSFDA